MNLENIRELIRLMKDNQINEIDWESEGQHIRIKAAAEAPAPVAPATVSLAPILPMQAVPAGPAPAAAPTAPPAAEAPGEPLAPEGIVIKSPIVGTFYRAPSPDKPAFVDIGDEITDESVLCIIEAMKVMNEIKAEMKGTVREVLVENGQPVEFGQPLFLIEPAD